VQKSPARFDEQRLLWLNGQHIRLLSLDDLYARSLNFWSDKAHEAGEERQKQVLALVKDRLKTLADIPTITDYFFEEPTPNWTMIEGNKQLVALGNDGILDLLNHAVAALSAGEFTPEALQETLNGLLETTGQKPGILFSLIRLAISWAPFSPALNETLAVLGKDVVINRLKTAISAL